VIALDGVIRHYAWGSRTVIPDLLGVEPDGQPAAELWFGAHPDDPSPVPGLDSTLDTLIAATPDELLGAATAARFGPRLPFLLKVLAVESALSIQVHPTLEQARAGFAAEDAAGIARDAPNRNYRDTNHKPELLCALSPFEVLCGFRSIEDSLRLFDAWDLAELQALRALLAGPDGLRAAFTMLLTLDAPGALVAAVGARAASVSRHDEWAGVARAVRLMAEDFPGDIGVVLGLLLNYVRLEPGEAIYLDAGTLHCYLRGTGVEIMANSDNVLRCGLTAKHIDVDELLRITGFGELADPRWPRGAFGFDAPLADFRLGVHDDGGELDYVYQPGSPRIVLCTEGSPEVAGLTLAPGHAAFVPAGTQLLIQGYGTVFVAMLGASR